MTNYKLTQTAISVHHESDSPLHGKSATKVILEDGGAGAYIAIEQVTDGKKGRLVLDMEELELVLMAARKLMNGLMETGAKP